MKKYILPAAIVIVIVASLFYYYEKNTPASTGQTSVTQTASQTQSGASPSGITPTAPSTASATYKDGEYTGKVADAYFGNLQVKATVQGGKLTDVQYVQYPNDRPTSSQINEKAIVTLRQEAIQSQNSKVDIVSGATQSSQAFQESLADALAQASS